MGTRKRSKIGECVYCGRKRLITKDHIPPKSIFSKPRPTNLITVPSCTECHGENKQVSQDDEYFRLALTIREDTGQHPDVKQILSTVLRSLARPDKLGFTRSLLHNIRPVNVFTPSGLFLGRKSAYDVNLARLDRVAERITKGLFFHERGYRLPDSYGVEAFSESGLQDMREVDKQALQATILQPLLSNTPKTIGNRVFTYWVASSDTDANITAWLLLFYEQVAFLCLTAPHNDIK